MSLVVVGGLTSKDHGAIGRVGDVADPRNPRCHAPIAERVCPGQPEAIVGVRKVREEPAGLRGGDSKGGGGGGGA